MMRKTRLPLLSIVLLALLVISCKSKLKQQEDQLYSRHLQKHIKLSIIATAMPDDKSQLNLLVLNDGQDLAQLRVKEIIDSLYQKDLIKPVLVVAIYTNDRMKELGVADYPDYLNRGEKAGKYADFINNELYFFAKKGQLFVNLKQ